MDHTFTATYSGLEIAVIGMAGRFPGAKNIDEFWENLKNGKETITFFSDEELLKAGENPELLKNPNYVKAAGILNNIDQFDAPLFGYTPKEAEVLNPQTRLFYECVYEALENAGYMPENYTGSIGLYGGATNNYAWDALTIFSSKSQELGSMAASSLSEKDNLTTRISYKLNLTGPSVFVKTACSTSLVAVHTACRALLTKECDLALAGGVSIINLDKRGYIYQKGLTQSADGHCRPFDADATGTIFGDGAGVVVLKKLKNAIDDGDHIHAIIKGSALNNDGFRKVSYSAPSVEGQADVIKKAMKTAGVTPDTVGFLETHGTATNLGDTVEFEALKIAFGNLKGKTCILGGVKSNIGHLEAASGVSGLIKTILVLKHKLIPPTLHFKAPNPEIDYENSPFTINTELIEWKTDNRRPLRAGISSFGIGGTNAHVTLEEVPPHLAYRAPETEGRPFKLLLLSARTQNSLERMTANFAGHLKNNLKNNPNLSLADVAYTLQTGRREHRTRKMLVCGSVAEAVDELTKNSKKVKTFSCKADKTPVIFILSGQGGQYVDMGKDLYFNEPLFRQEMDRAFELAKPLLDYQIKDVLYQTNDSPSDAPSINRPEVALSVNFILEYSIARLLMRLGVIPHAMTGYSFGEYAAACLAGVFSLEEALKLVVARGKLMSKTSPGAMLGVPLPEAEIRPLLDDSGVSLAIINGSSCVVAGSVDEVNAFERQLREKRLLCTPVNMGHAVHSSLMNPIRKDLEEQVGNIKLNPPRIPYISSVSGTWITPSQALNAGYWGEHLCSPVRFSDGINELLKIDDAVFVEIGPGRLLSNIVRQLIHDATEKAKDHQIVNMVKHQQEKHPDDYYFLSKLGELWLYGVPINWSAYYGEEKRLRVPLPSYVFDRKRYWVEPDPRIMELLGKAMQTKDELGGTSQFMLSRNEEDARDDREEMVPGDEGMPEDYEAPRDELETNIEELWRNILGFSRIGIHDNFYDINGDSLTATQMITRLQQVYPVEISLKAFLENPTIAHLAEIIKQLLMEKIDDLSEEELDALVQQDIL
ncbi:MAG: beta-ketoacyl synthase N-terminal-like domain-containing protein [Candidatus Omnitrophota bacterium]